MLAETIRDFPMFVDGASVESSTGHWLEVHSPASGALVGRVPSGGSADVDRAVAAARAAFVDERWSRSLPGRVAALSRLADLIETHAEELAALETAQTGSAYKLRRYSDLPFAIDNLRFFAGAVREARRLLSAAPSRGRGSRWCRWSARWAASRKRRSGSPRSRRS